MLIMHNAINRHFINEDLVKIIFGQRRLKRLTNQWRCLSDERSADVNGDEYKLVAERGIPKTKKLFREEKRALFAMPDDARFNRVAIIGMPNAGKSTLTNQLIGWKMSSVSPRVHTTRKNVIGVFVEGSTQVEILDTPGIVTPQHCVKYNLEPTFIGDPKQSAETADLITVICDASNRREREKLNKGILNMLYKFRHKSSILVLNKVDVINAKRKLMCVIDVLTEQQKVESEFKTETRRKTVIDEKSLSELFTRTEQRLKAEETGSKPILDEIKRPESDQKGWPYFSKVFLTSALTGDGVDELRDYMIKTAKPSPWKYSENFVTDQEPEKLAISLIREKLLTYCQYEVPYDVVIKIDAWDVDPMDTLWIVINIVCAKSRHVSMVLGPQGITISKIANDARQELSNAFHCEVSLKVIVTSTEKPNK